MKKFHDDMAKYNQHQCTVCKELWPTKEVPATSNYICPTCKKERNDGVFKFSLENDMIRDYSKIPDVIQQHLRELTMMEEMLLSPVLPVMTVYRLKTGGNVSRGFVANLKQDSLKFIKKIPLTADQLPISVVRSVGQNNEAVDLKVNRARVSLVWQWLVNNHPCFQQHNVSFNEEQCNVLPAANILRSRWRNRRRRNLIYANHNW